MIKLTTEEVTLMASVLTLEGELNLSQPNLDSDEERESMIDDYMMCTGCSEDEAIEQYENFACH